MTTSFRVLDAEGNAGTASVQVVVAAPQAATLYGISGGDSVSATAAWSKTKRMRTYNPAQLKAALALGLYVLHSIKVDLNKLAAGDQATIDAMVAEYRLIPDRPGPNGPDKLCFGHETNNDPAQAGKTDVASFLTLAAVYVKAWAVFFAKVLPAANAGRVHPFWTTDIIASVAYTLPGGREPWWIEPPAADLPRHLTGYDNYSPPNWPRIAATQAAHGRRPWLIAETGIGAAGGSDPQKLARMQADRQAYLSASPPAAEVYAWNQDADTLDGNPEVQTWWTSLCVLG